MTHKHTKAPWCVVDEKVRDGRIVYIQDDWGDSICDLYYKHKDDIIHFNNMEANAPLIAAAPDLLAACELSIGFLHHESWDEEAEIVQKAINKAKGV